MKSFSMRLGLILGLSIASLVFILTLALTYTISERSAASLEREIGERLSTTSHQLVDKLDFYMWSRYQEVQLLQGLDALTEPRESRALLDEVQTNIPAFSWMGVTDASGTVTASTDGILEGMSIAERPVFSEAQQQPFIGDVHEAVLLAEKLPNPSGEPLQFVDISVPIMRDGEFKGVLATHLSWEWGDEMLQHFNRTLHHHSDYTDMFVVSGRDNTVLLGPDHLVGTPLPTTFNDGWHVETWEDGKSYLTGVAIGEGYDDYAGLGWSVVVRQPIDVAFAPVTSLQNNILWIGLVASIVTALLGWLLALFVTRPLQKITETATLMKQGKVKTFPHQSGIREIESLAFALESLVTSLTNSETERIRFESLANHDVLTGLANRTSLRQYLNDAQLTTNDYICFYIDLDGFKAVNDTYGHASGDEVLVEIADRLKQLPLEGLYPVRLSGDEFFLLFERNNQSDRDVQQIGEDVIAALSAPVSFDGGTAAVGVSIGAALWRSNTPPHLTIERADQALYRSKASGKNQITLDETLLA
ncbi:sensor domain-containing diguanylate cyclase [Exiguobacterium sp. SH1S21]|uniref:diguanylate cyclase domain-containing protein n=1 Tax=Exiguobacterium sp. SH1S21 TaxID=2510953 RepID=UPI0010399FFE|nr:diguanylate cyclase [Exiguobacterium sp. SH1S21]TCI53814.1 sensor domain-containing diguanylate cyclase [Exiguobacterium sp. SH1S21]